MKKKKLDPADYEGDSGICLRCKEWTSVTEPCCGDAVYFEGRTIHPDDFEEEE